MTQGNFGIGQQTPADVSTRFNALSFLIKQLISLISTATEVKVISCTNDGGVSPVGFVDVQPLVNLLDGAGNASPHDVVYGLPYIRIQGGANAVIIDPQPGDIGIAIFADRDISSVKANKAQANPGSRRRFDMADGIYVGGNLNAAPTQYVQFSEAGITVVSPVAVAVQAPIVTVDASSSVTVTSPIINLVGEVHLGSTGGVPAAQEGTVDTGGFSDVSNLATKVFVT